MAVELLALNFAGEEISASAEGRTIVNPLYLPLPLSYLVVLAVGIILSGHLGRFLIKTLRA